jgi:hypothetical protein
MPMTADYVPIPIPIRIHYSLPIANAKSPAKKNIDITKAP